MVQGSSVARMYSVMQELQRVREDASVLSQKNRQLAKALNKAKQEFAKARMEKSAVFSDKVVEWMDARCKPVEVKHQGTQCNFEDFEQGSYVSMDSLLEPEPPLSPQQSVGATQTLHSDSRVPSPFACMSPKATHQKAVQECEDIKSHEDEHAVEYKAAIMSVPEDNNVIDLTGEDVESEHLQNLLSPPGLGRSNSQARRLRHRDAGTSYVEPKLNAKLRQGDYYGLGKRTTQPSRRHRSPKLRVISESPRATSTLSVRQCRRRLMRPVQRISYAEPKINTKLRQGDKFTFTT